MTDHISFPSSGKIFGKIRILCFHHYQPKNSGNEKLKKSFGDCTKGDWVETVSSFGK